jgi:hypothetical protein
VDQVSFFMYVPCRLGQGCGGGGGSDGPAIPSTGVSGSVSDAVTGSPIAGVSIQVSKPETTTIYQQVPGTYRFSVHDFTNEGHLNTTDLSNSEAQVRVYFGDSLVETFNVPTNKVGNTWTVFEWNGTTITPIDIFSDVALSPDVK